MRNYFCCIPENESKVDIMVWTLSLIILYIRSKLISSHLLSSLHVSVICAALFVCFSSCVYIYIFPHLISWLKWKDCNNSNLGILFYYDLMNHIAISSLRATQGNNQPCWKISNKIPWIFSRPKFPAIYVNWLYLIVNLKPPICLKWIYFITS